MPARSGAFLPRLRPLDIKHIVHQGQAYFLLRDPLGLNENQLLVPEALGPLLALCDGTREASALPTAVRLRTGVSLAPRIVDGVLEQLSRALFLDDARFAAARAAAEATYREAPFRVAALAGKVYPEEVSGVQEAFGAYCVQAGIKAAPNGSRAAVNGSGPIVGVISPHIDYQRGNLTYAAVWTQAAPAIREADLVIVLGTDHAGGPGRLTLTRQSYATPWGVLPTPEGLVDRMAREIGPEAFEEELHHRHEHSIELAAVWLHYFMQPRTCEVLPILCGSFHEFVDGTHHPERFETFERVLGVLREATRGRRVLVIAAADLAHVGPAFGDPTPYTEADQHRLHQSDGALLQAIREGDHRRFFGAIQQESDRHRICGMPPIYLTLRLLEGSTGEAVHYEQCPADADGGSLVSIAGAVLRARPK